MKENRETMLNLFLHTFKHCVNILFKRFAKSPLKGLCMVLILNFFM